MEIRMLRTLKGSPDGFEVREYEAGRKYDVPEGLAENFLGQGAAEEDKELVLETKPPILKSQVVTLSVKPAPKPSRKPINR